MRGWGIFLIVAAVASVLLPKVGMQLLVVAWVDHWGRDIGWVIRGVIAAVGVALLFTPRRRR